MLKDFKLAFRVFSEFIELITFEKNEALFAKILHIDIIHYILPYIYIYIYIYIYVKNKSGPNTVPCGTPELFIQSEV